MEPNERTTPHERPTPEEIDAAIHTYEVVLAKAKTAQEDVDTMKNMLVCWVDEFGNAPAHAEQSKRLAGRRHEATITRGTTVTVYEPAVHELGDYLAGQNLFELFGRFFTPQTKHTLVEGARNVLKTLVLPRRTEETIQSLFGRAINVKSRAPSLKIETIDAEKPTHKTRNGKAAA